MARALARGFLASGVVQETSLCASDVMEQARTSFAGETGGQAFTENRDVFAHSDVVFLATKPQGIDALLQEIKPFARTSHLVVSIAAGVSLKRLADGLGSEHRLIRVMPNTPCLVGESASGFSLGEKATESDAELVQTLLSAVGIAFRLPESLLDAVTGLGGSGPAYVYQIIEALSDGGVKAGLPRDVATRLAAQTLLGSAKMVLQSGMHPGQLKDMVTSPGGTTIAGLSVLERGALRGVLIDAVVAATERSRELGAK